MGSPGFPKYTAEIKIASRALAVFQFERNREREPEGDMSRKDMLEEVQKYADEAGVELPKCITDAIKAVLDA